MLASSTSHTQLDYELGVLRMFGEADIGPAGLITNWADPEESHVWNNGPEPTMSLSTSIPEEACILEIGGNPFSHPIQPHQEITLYANGFRLASWFIQQPTDILMRALIEPEHFFRRDKKAVLKLTWHIPTSVSPRQIGAGADDRVLGFVFRTLRLTPTSMM